MQIPLISSDVFEGHIPVNWHYDPSGFNGQPALVGTPCLELWLDTGNHAEVRHKGAIEFEGYAFFVVGNKVFRIDKNGTKTELTGTLNTSAGSVSSDISPTHLMIVDGSNGYYVAATDTTILTQITSSYFPSTPLACQLFGSRFAVTDGSKVYYSYSVNSPVDWDGSYVTPDGLDGCAKGLIEDHNELVVFGSKRAQPYYSDATAVYAQYEAGVMERGIAATHSVAKLDNSVYWLAEDRTVRKIDQYTPIMISNPELNKKLENYTTISDAIGLAFSIKGNSFYCLAFPTERETWLFNAQTGQWCQWAYGAQMYRHRANCYLHFNDMHLIGDYENGKIYKLSYGVFTDDGEVVRSERIAPMVQNEDGDKIQWQVLRMFFKSGVGLATGQGSDPKLMFSYSDDLCRTFSNERMLDMGKIGDYNYLVRIARMGISRGRNVKIAITDPIERVLYKASLKARVIK